MPFHAAEAISWSDFFGGSVNRGAEAVQTDESTATNAGAPDTSSGDVIKTTTTAADTRNVQELQARIRQAGGVLKANANSSDYIVAINNRLKFSVVRVGDQFEIRESNNFYYLVGAAVLVGVLVLAKR